MQNLLKHNAYIQEEMENYVREDEAIINVIRRKRIISLNNYGSLRSSRNDTKLSARNYQWLYQFLSYPPYFRLYTHTSHLTSDSRAYFLKVLPKNNLHNNII